MTDVSGPGKRLPNREQVKRKVSQVRVLVSRCWMRSGGLPVAMPLSAMTGSVKKQSCRRSHVTWLTYYQICPFPWSNPFQFVRRARRNVPLSAVGHAMRLAGELHRPLASRMTPSLTHDVTTPLDACKNGLNHSNPLSVNRIKHVLWAWIFGDQVLKTWVSGSGRMDFEPFKASFNANRQFLFT